MNEDPGQLLYFYVCVNSNRLNAKVLSVTVRSKSVLMYQYTFNGIPSALHKQIFASDLYTKHTLLCDTIIRKVFNSKTPPCSSNIEIIIFFYCIFNSQPEKFLPFPPKAHLYSIDIFRMINFNMEDRHSFDSVAIETHY